MKIFGHTMGTPHYSVTEALRLFSHLGFDGAEVVVQDGFRSGLPEQDDRAVEEVARAAEEVGIEVGALTPYVYGINSLDEDERRHSVERLRRTIEIAVRLAAGRIRIYSGSFTPKEADIRPQKWERLVDSLRTLGDMADSSGVLLCCENHFSTMSLSAAETAELVRAVDSPAVKALYDQANLTFTHQEPYEKAIELQSGIIGHVHAKDLIFTDASRPFVASEVAKVSSEERAIRSRVIGDGILDWKEILARLRADGYDGPISLEYEYRWHPQDLPEPTEGLATGLQRLRKWLSELYEEGR